MNRNIRLSKAEAWVREMESRNSLPTPGDLPHVHFDDFMEDWLSLSSDDFLALCKALRCSDSRFRTVIVCDIVDDDIQIPGLPRTLSEVIDFVRADGTPPAVYLQPKSHVSQERQSHENRRVDCEIGIPGYATTFSLEQWDYKGTNLTNVTFELLQIESGC